MWTYVDQFTTAGHGQDPLRVGPDRTWSEVIDCDGVTLPISWSRASGSSFHNPPPSLRLSCSLFTIVDSQIIMHATHLFACPDYSPSALPYLSAGQEHVAARFMTHLFACPDYSPSSTHSWIPFFISYTLGDPPSDETTSICHVHISWYSRSKAQSTLSIGSWLI